MNEYKINLYFYSPYPIKEKLESLDVKIDKELYAYHGYFKNKGKIFMCKTTVEHINFMSAIALIHKNFTVNFEKSFFHGIRYDIILK